MKLKSFLHTLVCLMFLGIVAAAQVPDPQLRLTGNIGSGGVFPLLNSGSISYSSDADYTLAYPDMSAYFIMVTSSVSLTATRNLVAPVMMGYSFVIENATTGGQSIQVIGSTGTGVTIPNGSVVQVANDGTNYVAVGTGGGGGGGNLSGTLTADTYPVASGAHTLEDSTITDSMFNYTGLTQTLALGGTTSVIVEANDGLDLQGNIVQLNSATEVILNTPDTEIFPNSTVTFLPGLNASQWTEQTNPAGGNNDFYVSAPCQKLSYDDCTFTVWNTATITPNNIASFTYLGSDTMSFTLTADQQFQATQCVSFMGFTGALAPLNRTSDPSTGNSDSNNNCGGGGTPNVYGSGTGIGYAMLIAGFDATHFEISESQVTSSGTDTSGFALWVPNGTALDLGDGAADGNENRSVFGYHMEYTPDMAGVAPFAPHQTAYSFNYGVADEILDADMYDFGIRTPQATLDDGAGNLTLTQVPTPTDTPVGSTQTTGGHITADSTSYYINVVNGRVNPYESIPISLSQLSGPGQQSTVATTAANCSTLTTCLLQFTFDAPPVSNMTLLFGVKPVYSQYAYLTALNFTAPSSSCVPITSANSSTVAGVTTLLIGSLSDFKTCPTIPNGGSPNGSGTGTFGNVLVNTSDPNSVPSVTLEDSVGDTVSNQLFEGQADIWQLGQVVVPEDANGYVFRDNTGATMLYSDNNALQGGSLYNWNVPSEQISTPFVTSTLPACSATGGVGGVSTLLMRTGVTDATVATPGSAYVGGGTYSIGVECIYNSATTTYSWIID